MMELLKSINKNNELYTKYNDRFYAIQEYIEEWKMLRKLELRKK